jgi:hypothetical protein
VRATGIEEEEEEEESFNDIVITTYVNYFIHNIGFASG